MKEKGQGSNFLSIIFQTPIEQSVGVFLCLIQSIFKFHVLLKPVEKSNSITKRFGTSIVLLAYALIAIFCICYFNGTGDAGDSVLHYLFAKYSWEQPELLLHHWAKPFFTLVASPFAQFGFIGMKVFNVIVMLLAVFFTIKSAQKLELRFSIISGVFLICMPLCFVLTFSGLTEPLFALFTILSVYLILKEKLLVAAIILSFLPFVRSEGLIIIGVISLFFLFKKEWKALLLLSTGHIVYSIIGSFYYQDIFWVFTKNPYAKLSSTYGDGDIFHFVNQLLYVIGIPLYILFWVGTLGILRKVLVNRSNLKLFSLILLPVGTFIVAHSLFWHLGIFNSMGLNRVLICIAPLLAIIGLVGLNSISIPLEKLNRKSAQVSVIIIISFTIIFPFLNNPASINWDKELNLSADQLASSEVAEYLKNENLTDNRMVYIHPMLSLDLELNHFNKEKRVELDHEYLNNPKSGDLIIWENWFSVVEVGVQLEDLKNHSELVAIKSIHNSKGDKTSDYHIFLCK